jgi:general secretion pathway protein D
MKKIVVALCLMFSFAVHAAKPQGVVNGPSFDFRAMSIAQVIQLIYSEAVKGSYVIDPEVLADARIVSFRYDPARGDLRSFINAFFDSIGLSVTRRESIDFIAKKRNVEPPKPPDDVFVYLPQYRDGSYLADLLSPLFKGSFTVRRAVHASAGDKSPQKAVPPSSAAAQIEREADTLVFSGTDNEIEKLKKVLAQVDTPLGEVMVRAVLYEVSSSGKDGSAFSLALNLLNGKLSAGFGDINPVDTFVRLKNQSIDAVFSALSSDSRFKVISTPSLRVRSGRTGRFTVGQDVPVLGAVSYPGNGQAPVQSVEYRSSGVIFELQPEVHEKTVDLNVAQQVSNFVATDTGVNSSPTLIKREVNTALSVADGDVVVLGGLAENKESDGTNGLSFMPDFLRSKNSEKSRSEILLILQLSRI